MMEPVPVETIPSGVDSRIVERTIRSGFPWLKFPRRLEIAFESEDGVGRCRQLAIGGMFGVVLYNLFLISDRLTAPENFQTALWLRLGIVTPLALLLIASLYLNPPVGMREFLVAAGAVILGAGSNVYLMLAGHGPHHDAQHQVIILVLLFITMVQRVRFWYAVAACLACFALHALGLAMLPAYPVEFQVSANAVFGCAVVLSIFASYVLEREMRMNFLLSVRGRLQRRELDVESRRDPLTGLRNRRSLDEVIELCNQNKAGDQELAIVLLDIDHFKAFNDSAGHQAGDACLKRVAGIIQSELRDHVDTAFRFGGEEFILVLRGVDLTTAVRISERIRRAIEDAAIPHPALPIGEVVTVSMGVASAIVSREIRVGVIISAADSALYAAKRNGRNQVSPRLPVADVVVPDRKLRLI